jgi:putative transposase
MYLNYRYRLVPTKRQHRALEDILESQRQLYNAALEERIDAYRKAGITRTYIDQTRALTEWRQSDRDAAALPVTLQRATLKRLDNAYNNFFRRIKKGEIPGFPRFRGSGWFHSFGFREFSPRVGVSLRGEKIRFKGMPGGLRVHFHRALPLDCAVVGCTLRRDCKGWSVIFGVKVPTPPERGCVRAVGIDLGITTFATLSDGQVIPSLRAARKAQRALRLAQRAFRRKERNSKNRTKARLVQSRCHASITRCRIDHAHKASAFIARNYEVIAVEALQIKGLARGGNLAHDIRDASWSRFLSMLRYKAERAGARLIEVNPRNTSQECSRCGAMVAKQLAERWHNCPLCGLSLDRDLNAAKNILNRAGVGPGLQNVAGCGKRADGNLSECRPMYASGDWGETPDPSTVLLPSAIKRKGADVGRP